MESAAMTPAVRISGITKSFGNLKAIDSLSFDVPQNTIFGLLGPNGAGKTTLFSIIANFLQSDGGSIEVLGTDVRRPSELRGRMTILPQDAEFQGNVPIMEQLVFFRLLDGRSRAEAEREVMEALGKVGLEEYSRRGARVLSHGMTKRLGIAQAFLGEPEVILLDEPTAGLDPQNANQIRELVRDLQTRATIVISSHNMFEIQDLCDHVAIVDKGKLIQTGSVDEVTGSGRELDLRVSRDFTPEELARLKTVTGVLDVRTKGEKRYTVSVNYEDEGDEADANLSSLLRQVLDLGVTPRGLAAGTSLETHFLQVTGEGETGK